MKTMTDAGWIPAEKTPEQFGQTYKVRIQRLVTGIPEVAETTAMWTTDGWELTDGLFPSDKMRVLAWRREPGVETPG